jgi:hypothetical protein
MPFREDPRMVPIAPQAPLIEPIPILVGALFLPVTPGSTGRDMATRVARKGI